MALPKTLTATYSPDELADILIAHLKTQGYQVVGNVAFDNSPETVGQGMGERDESVFKGAVVQIKPITGLSQLELLGQ